MVLASTTFTVSGIDGFFYIVAALAFLIAAIIAWFVPPRVYWPTLIAGGLFLWVLTNLVH